MPAINNPSQYFGVITYTGDGSSSKTVVDTNAIQFTPDFVWIKGRSGATDHALYDAVRGSTKDLVSNSTAAETTQSTGVTGFVNGGFTVGNLAKLNTSGATYVAWCWKANGAGSSNTSGSITSTVSVSTTAGFSVVTYTGTGSTKTFGHGLGVTPAMFIVKSRSQIGENWVTWHKSFSNTAQGNMSLNATDAVNNSASVWGNTAPTSTLITVGNSAVNNNTSTYVAYCFADVQGYSKAFSYTGNGSSDGPFTYLGFKPKWIMIKNSGGGATSSLQGWIMLDTSRSTYNQTADALFANNSNASNSGTTYAIDILSNGFKTRGTDGSINESSATYIGMAFAEHPFKNANAR